MSSFHLLMDAAAQAVAAMHKHEDDDFDFDYMLEFIVAPTLSPEDELIFAEMLVESGEIEFELDIESLIELDRYLSSFIAK